MYHFLLYGKNILIDLVGVILILYTLIVISVLLILLSLTYIKIYLVFHRINEDDIIEIKLLIFNLIKFRFRIPYIDVILNRCIKPGIKAKGALKSKDKTLSKRKETLNFDELKIIYEKAVELLRIYERVIDYILSKIYFESIKWYTEVGLEDAAVTALSTGVLWSIKGSIMSVLSNKVSINEIQLNVRPNYNKLTFQVELDCIIRIKIANIIIAGIKAFYTLVKNTIFKKGGEINEPASYRRANENHNG